MKRTRNFWLKISFALSLVIATSIAVGSNVMAFQSVPQGIEKDKNGKMIFPLPEVPVMYNPTDLFANGLAYGSNTSTVNTKTINVAGVHAMTLFINCTSTVTVNAVTFDETGATYATYGVVTGVTAGANQVYLSTELAPNATIGTVAVNIRMPQQFLAFSFTNTNATAGSCTARLLVRY